MNVKLFCIILLLVILHLPIYIFASYAASSAIMNYLRAEVHSKMDSLCHVPFMSIVCSVTSWKPKPVASTSITTAFNAEFDSLGRLLHSTADTSPQISQEMARARYSVDDLILVVKGGGLRCANRLVEELKAFGGEACVIAHNLERFVWKVDASAKRVESANEQIIALLQEKSATTLTLRALCAMSGNHLPLDACQRSRELRLMFNMTLHAFESTITTLMDMSEVLNVAFISLEARLETIRDIVADEGNIVLAEKDEVLADIWTALGANRKAWARLRTQAHALRLIGTHHKVARHFVSLAHQELVTMDVALEDLQSVTVESMLNQENFPVGVLIETLSQGVKRLKEGRKAGGNRLTLGPKDGPFLDSRSTELYTIE